MIQVIIRNSTTNIVFVSKVYDDNEGIKTKTMDAMNTSFRDTSGSITMTNNMDHECVLPIGLFNYPNYIEFIEV